VRFVLRFLKPDYHQGLNLTIRNGKKWYNQAPVGSMLDIVKTGSDVVETEAQLVGSRTLPFLAINEHELYLEHDPLCRDLDGLQHAMERAYPDFKETNEVAMLFFWVD